MLLKKSFALFSIVAILAPQLVLANTGEFNPNFIISDEEMQDASTMDREGIQVFLEENGSYLAHYKTVDAFGVERLASDMIYRAAQEYDINPKYILVTLQKEQSLITNPSPDQRTLDWATGYAICDACSKEDPKLQKNKGFGKQVDSSAGIIRWYYDNAGKEPYIRTQGVAITIDNQQVIPQSNATGFLYTYTPHIHGNKNFWTLWQKWFSQLYPDGSLVKAEDDATVYLIVGNEKRAFKNFTALITRFDPELILTIPAAELANYTVGPAISLPNYAILRKGNSYYLLDDNTLRPFKNQSVVRNLGFHPDEVIEVTAEDIVGYDIGETITSDSGKPQADIIKLLETGELYVVKDNTIRNIMSQEIFEANYRNATPRLISIAELGTYERADPILFKDGTLLGMKGSNRIYVMEEGKRRHIANEEVFLGLGYKWENVRWIDEVSGLVHPPGQAVYLNRKTNTSPTMVAGISVTGDDSKINTSSVREEDGRIWMTPEANAEYVGTERFATPVNTYLVADARTGQILAGKNIDEVRPLASLTKVYSAYIAMREGLNPNKGVAYSAARHHPGEDLNGYSFHNYKIAEGEVVLAKDLLDATLVSSINTTVYMMLTAVGKKSTAFTAEMNSFAKELGTTQTRFVDPIGIDLRNVSTARDYLTLYRRATDNLDIATSLGKTSYVYDEQKDIDGYKTHRDNHSNPLVNKAGLPFEIITSKTGYLDEAGRNLVMHIRRPSDGKEFVVITLGNPDISRAASVVEPEKISRWAIENF